MGKMLFVDLTRGKILEKEISNDEAKSFIGGVGIGGKVIYEYIKPGCDPFSPDNILGFGTGPLTLSGAFCASRFTVMGKSPLTGYWATASGGGTFGTALKASGYDFIFVLGRARQPVYLVIQEGKAELKNASNLWGKDTVQTEKILREEEGNKRLQVACIGPAGEKLSRIAAVINEGARAAARSGLGAVMGSKNLKAIACDGNLKPDVFNEEKIAQLMKETFEEAKANPSMMFRDLIEAGTCSAVVPHLATHDTPIKNWAGTNVKDFPEEKWEKVGRKALEKYIIGKYYCPGCPIGCGGWVRVPSGRFAIERAHKPEYETIAAFGPLCLNDDIESIIYANDLCNRYGLDTISTGASIAFAMECYERGILTKEDTGGLEIKWGDSEVIVNLVHKIAMREGIGDILADGPRWAARRIGKGAEQYSMDVCGEPIPMHDPRFAVGWGMTYIVNAEAAKHTRGFAEGFVLLRTQLAKELGLPERLDRYDVSDERGRIQTIILAWYKGVFAAGLCLFGHDSMKYPLVDTLNAVTGWNLTINDIVKIGMRINTLLHMFNLREGWKPSDYTLPPRVTGRPPLPEGSLKNVTIDYETLRKSYYRAMGWDPETGAIPEDKIKELGLHELKSQELKFESWERRP